MSIIKLENIKKTYSEGETETHALRDVSFNVEKGEFIAVMGPSGSGKSTLLHIIGFLDRPTSGDYLFRGKNMNKYSDDELAYARSKEMGFIFQSFNLLPRTSVLDNVKLPLIYADIPESKQDKMAKVAIEKVGLIDRINHEPSQLSGGEKQRVAIARALVNDPYVVFADEPTGNLDSKSGGQVMEFMDDLHSEGHTIILITHETYTANYAQRIVRLKDGRIESDKKVTGRHKAKDHFVK
jgi:putative ABC transport system ATP-binding protein